MINLNDVDPHLRTEGTAAIQVGGQLLQLDLSSPHERRYAARGILHMPYPQADIDRLLLERFVRKGDRVLDGGANIGMTAMEAIAAGAAQVTCVEPIASLAKRIKALRHSRIRCLEAALTDRRKPIDLWVSQSHNQGSTSRREVFEKFRFIFGDQPQTQRVRGISIDDIGGRFDVWKLDLEGAEADAIRGASKSLKTRPPRVVIAEIFDELFDEFSKLLRPTHPVVRRALIDLSTYELALEDPRDAAADLARFHPTSPMYVFLAD